MAAVFYAVWEIPSNLVCRAMGARPWIALQIVSFGIVCLCTAFIHSFSQFVVSSLASVPVPSSPFHLADGRPSCAGDPCLARSGGGRSLACDGAGPDAVLHSGRVSGTQQSQPTSLLHSLTRLLTPSRRLVFRMSILVSASSLSGAFGGLLASGFISIKPLGMVHSWRHIFLWEGVITIMIGVVAWFFVPNDPATAYFLTPAERTIAVERLVPRNSSGAVSAPISKESQRRLTRNAFLSIPTWLCTWGFLATNVSVQGVSLFLPTIIRALYPTLPTVQVQLRTVPPYVVAFVWSISLAYLSNRLDRRGWVLLCTSPFCIAGYVIFVATQQADIRARYAGAFLCILGAFPIGPFLLAWANNNAATDTERGVASGLVPGFGQFGAMIATWSYLPNDAPNYYHGNSINIGFASMAWSITAVMVAYLIWENKARRAGKRDHRLAEVRDDEDASAVLGSRHPAFIYSI